MYAIEMFMNYELEHDIRKIWGGLSDNAITSNMIDIKHIRPHITLSVYNEIPIIEFKEQFNIFTKDISKFDLSFDILGTFPVSGTIFISPTVTSKLLEIHKKTHIFFENYKESTNEYYLPNKWNPHCTLAIQLNSEKMIETFEYCIKNFKPLKGKIEEIAIDKIIIDGNKIVSSETILSKKLL